MAIFLQGGAKPDVGATATAEGRSHRLGVAAAVVGDAVVPGDVVVADGRIAAVGAAPAGRRGLAVPGFVDLQVNGYAGVAFDRADPDGYAAACAGLAGAGTTHLLATIPTTAPDRYEPALAAAADAARRTGPGARVLGVHLEGPFLSPLRRGAHRADWLREIDAGCVERWLAAAPVRLVTLAPELPGALDLVRGLVRRGVVVAIGHTDADLATAQAAVDAGASAHTHVWNAHRPMRARDPASGVLAVTSPAVSPCFIVDLAHVAPEVLSMSLAACADRYIAVSDASSAAGLAPGRHEVGGHVLTVDDRAVQLHDGTLAGASSLLDAALRNLVALGRPLPEAVAAVSARPAALIGETEIGRLRVGAVADVVVLDDHLDVQRVLVGGEDGQDGGRRDVGQDGGRGDDV